MPNRSKLTECLTLGTIIFNRLLDLKEACKTEFKTLMRALGAEVVEEIQDIELYKIAVDLEQSIKDLGDKAEELNDFLESLSKINF